MKSVKKEYCPNCFLGSGKSQDDAEEPMTLVSRYFDGKNGVALMSTGLKIQASRLDKGVQGCLKRHKGKQLRWGSWVGLEKDHWDWSLNRLYAPAALEVKMSLDTLGPWRWYVIRFGFWFTPSIHGDNSAVVAYWDAPELPEIARGQLELPVNNVCLVGNVIQSPKAVTPLEKKKPGRKAGKEVMAKPAAATSMHGSREHKRETYLQH
jgi:hypothetical protein